MRRIWILPFLLSLLVLSGCVEEGPEEIAPDPASARVPSEESKEVMTSTEAKWYSVYFTYEDNVEANLVAFIDSAQDNIHAAIYDLDLQSVADAIVNAHKRGVEVIVIMDDEQSERAVSLNKYLKDNGVLVALDTSSGLMHNKVIVVDGVRVWTGSTNPTENGVNKNNNNAIVIESEVIAENYIVEIEEMYLQYQLGEAKTVKPTPHPVTEICGVFVENYFAPEDKVEDRILEELDAASSSIYFMVFTFTSDPIEQKLIEKYNAGVDVRGIFEARQTGRYAAYDPMMEAGIPVIEDQNGYTMHHKVFIIDNSTTITGSFNPTKAAETRNDENIIIVHDAGFTQEYLDEFKKLWSEWET